MIIEKLKHFSAKITDDPRVKSRTSGVSIFYHTKRGWDAINSERPSDPVTLRDLAITRRNRSNWKRRSHTTAYFPVPELDAVIKADFPRAPTKPTRQQFDSIIRDIYTNSSNAYDATHDDLTGLLNRVAFQHRLSELLHKITEQTEDIDDTISRSSSTTSALSLFAIDIDHFKQINDSYGHLYGDIVLLCLSIRLMSLLEDAKINEDSIIDYLIARPSGEEFLILLECNKNFSETFRVADDIRVKISDDVLPNARELSIASSIHDTAATITIPPDKERSLSISIGIANVTRAERIGNIENFTYTLRNRADTALYRAKSGGRNTVRLFSDIRNTHGRVLEHHKETDIVTIDVGRNVGVGVGQEFFVFHPDFSGNKDFLFADGRTTKRLGKYPRISCGRVSVFDSQEEISFCEVVERISIDYFPEYSTLEYIPVGSIGHLINERNNRLRSSDSAISKELDNIAQSAIAMLGEKRVFPFVMIGKLAEVDAMEENLGTSAVNDTLATFYQALRSNRLNSFQIGQIEPLVLAVAGYFESEDEQDQYVKTLAIIDKTVEQSTSLNTGTIMGIFMRNDFTAEFLDESSTVSQDESAISIVDLARYALSQAESQNKNINIFNSNTPRWIIYSARTSMNYEDAKSDYYKMSKYMNLEYSAHNQAGLVFVESAKPDYLAAIAAFSKGIELAPANAIMYANRAVAKCALHDWGGSLSDFDEGRERGWEFESPYLVPYLYAKYRAFKERIIECDAAEILKEISEASIESDDEIIGLTKEDLEIAVDDLTRIVVS